MYQRESRSCGGGKVNPKNTPEATSKADTGTSEQASNPQTSTDKGVYPTSSTPVVNVYLETSGSMNGYVNGGTSIFQQVVKEYLSGINNAGFASAVNYYYINSRQSRPQGSDLNKYITHLTPSSFAANGGGATTDIGGIFKTILGATDNNTISILISDCIISPGRSNDPNAYARGQMTDVRDAIVGYINQYQDLACLVYQFDSGFRGYYFDYLNSPHQVDMERPFYIWVFGHTAQVALLKLSHVPDRDFHIAPIRNQWMIFNTSLDILQPNSKYGLLLSTGAQNGNYSRVNANTLRAIQRYDSKYRFSFGANMKTALDLFGEDYVEDTNNYTHFISKATKEKFFGIIEKDFNMTSPYTHIYRVVSDDPFQKGHFTLAFTPKVPYWVYDCTDTDDRTFNGSNDNKTYGLNNIFEGVYYGFNSGGNDNILAQFDFEIK